MPEYPSLPKQPAEVEAFITRVDFTDTPKFFLAEAIRERRKRFGKLHENLEALPYIDNGEFFGDRQGFFRYWFDGEHGGTIERSVVVAKKYHEDLTQVAWHILINDMFPVDSETETISYEEYVLPVGKSFMDSRFKICEHWIGEVWDKKNLAGGAHLRRQGDQFIIFRGYDNTLLKPRQSWHIQEVGERYKQYDEAHDISQFLDDLVVHNAFQEHITGVIA